MEKNESIVFPYKLFLHESYVAGLPDTVFVMQKMEVNMIQNIIVGILCLIALAAGIWGWWTDNGGSF